MKKNPNRKLNTIIRRGISLTVVFVVFINELIFWGELDNISFLDNINWTVHAEGEQDDPKYVHDPTTRDINVFIADFVEYSEYCQM